MGFAQGAAEDAEVVGVDEDGAALDGAPAGDDAVGVGLFVLQAEAGRAVPAQCLDLGEAALVEEEGDAFVGGQFAFGVLSFGGGRVGAEQDAFLDLFEFFGGAVASWRGGLGAGRRVGRCAVHGRHSSQFGQTCCSAAIRSVASSV